MHRHKTSDQRLFSLLSALLYPLWSNKSAQRIVFLHAIMFALLKASVATASVVGIWTFEHGVANSVASGAGSILDYSGNGNHGTPFGSPVYSNSTSGVGSVAMGFSSAAHQKVFFADSAPFRITKSITIETVFRFDNSSPGNSYGHNMILFRGDDRGGLDPYYLSVDGGKLTFSINNTNPIISDSLTIGRWYRAAAVLDDTTGRQSLWLDGVEVAYQFTNQRPIEFLDTNFSPGIAIGGAQSNNFQFGFGGLIDEVRLYNSAVNYSAAVPEPISLLVWSLGGVATIVARRKGRTSRRLSANR
jgi:hypothetical protein